MKTPTLNLLVLKTDRMEECLSFYSALGLVFAAERHGSGPIHYSGRTGGLVLELYPRRPDGHSEAAVRLGFAVDDLSGVLGNVGGPSISPEETEWGRRAVVRDPDGRAVELYQA